MLKKFSVPLTSESVTSGQAGGVFRQLFLQCAVLFRIQNSESKKRSSTMSKKSYALCVELQYAKCF